MQGSTFTDPVEPIPFELNDLLSFLARGSIAFFGQENSPPNEKTTSIQGPCLWVISGLNVGGSRDIGSLETENKKSLLIKTYLTK